MADHPPSTCRLPWTSLRVGIAVVALAFAPLAQAAQAPGPSPNPNVPPPISPPPLPNLPNPPPATPPPATPAPLPIPPAAPPSAAPAAPSGSPTPSPGLPPAIPPATAPPGNAAGAAPPGATPPAGGLPGAAAARPCPAGSTWSSSEAACVAQPTCPPPARWQDGICIAEPVCPPGARKDGDRCLALVTCPPGTSLIQGACQAPVVCPSGTAWDASGKCLPTDSQSADCKESIAKHDKARDRDSRWARGPALQLSIGPGWGFTAFSRVKTAPTVPATTSTPHWQGPAFFAGAHTPLSAVVLGAVYTTFSGSYKGADYTSKLLLGEVARQCACVGSDYTWRVGTRVGYDFANDAYAIGTSSQSIWRLWQGLYFGIDIGTVLLVKYSKEKVTGGETTEIGLGPTITGGLFLGYSIH